MSRASSVPEMTRIRMPVCAIDLGDEVAAVVGFARGAGRGGDDLVDLVRVGQPPELGQGLERRGHGRRRQAAAVQAAGAQPDHVLFAVNDFEGQVRPDLDHDHVDRVGADVDGGYAHAEGGAGLSRAAACAVTRPLYTGRAGRPFLKNSCQLGKSYHEPCAVPFDPIAAERRARALKRHLPAAIGGDGIGVHQARVASRRLREAVPVLARRT